MNSIHVFFLDWQLPFKVFYVSKNRKKGDKMANFFYFILSYERDKKDERIHDEDLADTNAHLGK